MSAIPKNAVWAARVVLLVFIGAETRCAPRTAPPTFPLNPKLAPVKTEFVTPSWAARFGNPAGLLQCTPLDEHSRVCVGTLGERWLDDERGAFASPYLAPEDLVAALPTDSKTWIFVGRRGTRYAADTPLGPLTSVRRAPRDFTEFAIQSGQWFGLTSAGELWRGGLTDGQGVRANMPGRLFGFAIAPNGTGVAVAAPEQLWVTPDRGNNWTRSDAGPFGTRALTVDEHGTLTASVLLPMGEVSTEGVTVRTTRALPNRAVQLQHEPRAYPEAQGLIEGRSVRLGKDILELRNIDGGWYFVKGPISGPVTLSRVETLDECSNVRFATSGTSSIAVCRRRRTLGEVAPLRLFASKGDGVTSEAINGPILGNFKDLRLAAVGPRRFVATGVCHPNAPRNASEKSPRELHDEKPGPSCTGAPVFIELTPAEPNPIAGFTLSAARSTTTVSVTAPVLAVSDDGTRVAYVARAAKSPWHVFLSTDSGKTFTSHSIDDVPVTVTAAGVGKPEPHMLRESREVLSMHFGDDQGLSLVYRNGDAPIIANFDSRGGLVATAMAPPGVARADAVGPRILALSLSERNVYESLDRGASFELLDHLPGPACQSWLDCSLSCTQEGCLIGERFTRLSWGGRAVSPLDVAANAEAERPEPKTDLVSFRTPLSCEVQPRVAPVSSPVQYAPLPEQVGLEDALWISPWQDWATASAGAYRAARGARKIEKLSALAPLAHPERAGLAATFTDSGVAVLRAENLPKVGEPLGDLELAWLPRIRSTWAHARFRDAAAFKANDSYLYGIDKARKLLPEVLSVSKDDAFVQVHADDDRKLGTYFATQGKAELLPRIAWPFTNVRGPHWLKQGNTWRVFAFDDTGTELLRALAPGRGNDAPWQFAAQTVAEPFGTLTSIHDRVKAYFAGTRPYVVLAFTARGRQLQSLRLHDLRTDAAPLGPGIELPLPAAVNEPPPACNARDRRELRRVVVPLLPSAGRALGFVTSNGHHHWLVVNHAVMYASEQRACIDTLWAETLPGITPIHAVVSLEDPKRSWLFLSTRARGESQVTALSVECRFDATATAPPEFETRTQARYNLEHLPLE